MYYYNHIVNRLNKYIISDLSIIILDYLLYEKDHNTFNETMFDCFRNILNLDRTIVDKFRKDIIKIYDSEDNSDYNFVFSVCFIVKLKNNKYVSVEHHYDKLYLKNIN